MKKDERVVKGGLMVSGKGIKAGDILISGGVIQKIGGNLRAPRVIDASGKYVLPGLIDAHCHPVYTDKMDTFSISAAYGGVTTIIPFIGNISAWGYSGRTSEVVKRFIEEGEKTSYLDFAVHAAFAPEDDAKREIPKLMKMGVISFKMFMTYLKRGMMMPDDKMLEVMEVAAYEGGLAMVHPENGYGITYLIDKFTKAGKVSREYFMPSQPNILEVEAVYRACSYAAITDSPLYLVHLSAREVPEVVERIKTQVRHIYGETCPQYLSLTNQAVLKKGPLGKVGTPLREKEDNEAIWQALSRGSIDTVGSDSANIKAAQKEWGGASAEGVEGQKLTRSDNIFEARFGAAWAEQMLSVVYHDGVNGGRITLPRLVQVMCENPAKIFGLYPGKGTLQVGSDADLVIFDPSVKTRLSKKSMHSNADFTLFEGKRILGAPVFSMQRGEPLIEDGKLRRRQGRAKFLCGSKDLAAYAEHGFPVE